MDKKKLIGAVVAVLLAVVGLAVGIDFKGAICGAPEAAVSVEK